MYDVTHLVALKDYEADLFAQSDYRARYLSQRYNPLNVIHRSNLILLMEEDAIERLGVYKRTL